LQIKVNPVDFLFGYILISNIALKRPQRLTLVNPPVGAVSTANFVTSAKGIAL
jgi:hypothetical protein